MVEDEKARAGLFRAIFSEQLKIIEVERQINGQALNGVVNLRHLTEVGQAISDLHNRLTSHQRHLANLRLQMKRNVVPV